jgi:exonuclease VII small subunit
MIKQELRAGTGGKGEKMAVINAKTDLPAIDFSAMLNQLESIVNAFESQSMKLTPEQKKLKNAVGIKRKGFLDAVQGIAEKNVSYMPNYFNPDEFSRKLVAMRTLNLLQNAERKLREHLRITEAVICNEIYRDALIVHRYLREAAKSGIGGARPLYERLKKQFTRTKRGEASEAPETTETA